MFSTATTRRPLGATVPRSVLAVLLLAVGLATAFTAKAAFAADAPGLALTKVADKSSVAPGEVLTYTIRFRCASLTTDCTGVKLTDAIPSGASVVYYSPAGGFVTGAAKTASSVTWTMADPLAAGSSGVVQMKVIYTNTCVVTPTTIGQNTATLSGTNTSPLSISASAPPVTVTSNASQPSDCIAPPPPAAGSFAKKDTTAGVGGLVRWPFDLPANGGAQYTVTDTLPSTDFYLVVPWVKYVEVSCDGGTDWGAVTTQLDTAPPATASATTPNNLANTGCLQGAAPDGSGRYVIYSTDKPMKVRRFVNGHVGAIGSPASHAVPQIDNDVFIDVALSNDVAPGVYRNCATATLSSGAVTDCGDLTASTPAPHPMIDKSLAGYPGSEFGGRFTAYPSTDYVPLLNGTTRTQGPSDLLYHIVAYNYFTGGGDWVNPVITDLLDPNLTWNPAPGGTNFWVVDTGDGFPDSATEQTACHTPTMTATPNWNGTGRTQLRWDFTNCTLRGDRYGDSAAGFYPGFEIYVSATLKPGTAAATQTINQATTVVPGARECNFGPVTATDTTDSNGNGDTTDPLCASARAYYTMPELATTESSKWVHGGSDPNGYFSRFPNTGLADAGGNGTYEMFLENTGNIAMDRTHLVDVLPTLNDTMTIDPAIGRQSQWAEMLSSGVTVDLLDPANTVAGGPRNQDWSKATTLTPGTDYGIWYSTSTNPCRLDGGGQLKIATSGLSAPSGCATQPAVGSGTATGAKSFGILLNHDVAAYSQAKGHGAMVRITAKVNSVGTLTAADTGKIAWNSFAYTPFSASTTDPDGAGPLAAGEMLSTEPIKVGLKVGPGVTIGDYVWIDANHNGAQEASETGVDNVTVTLWGPGNDGLFGGTDDVLLDTFLTGDNPYVAGTQHGFYRFGGLDPSTLYQVRLSKAADFAAGGPLAGYALTTANDATAGDAADSDAVMSGGVPTITATSPAAPVDPTEPDDPTFDFGLWQPASLGDYVWYDQIPDGMADPSEPGVAGVKVTLFQPGPDGLAGTADDVNVASTTTDSTGHYLFTGLVPGDYFVQFDKTTLPTGTIFTFRDTTGNDANDSDANTANGRTVMANLVAGENDLTWDAGIRDRPATVVSIGDTVWFDNNRDGIQDTGEPGVSGVTVWLYDSSGIPVTSATTDANGHYSFTDLDPGDYQIQVVPPTGLIVTQKDQGGDDAKDSDIDPTAGSTYGFTAMTTLSAGENDPTWDAGLYGPMTLGNLVWNDANNNGVVDGSETGISGVTVNLYVDANRDGTPDGGVIATTTTNGTGHYLFTGLYPGTYIVEAVAPAGYTSSTGTANAYEPGKDPDTDATDSDDNGTVSIVSNTVVSRSKPVTLEAAGTEPTGEPATPGLTDTASDSRSNLTVDFGFIPTMSLGDQVWEDANNNGTLDGTEAGLKGVTVNLYRDANGDGTPDGAAIATTTTNNGGFYLFTGLAPGTYLVEIEPPSSYLSSTGTANAFEPAPDPDTTATDSDDNGTLSGLTIWSAPVTLTINGEPTGEPAPTGLTDPATDANSNLTVDFGLFRTLSLGDVVWGDTNDNGTLDATESGVDGVTVKLFKDGTEVNVGPDGILGNADDAPGGMVTHDGGKYLFANLLAGDYVVKIETPTGYRSSTDITTTATPNNDINSDDNGVGATAGTVSSNAVTLAPGSEPVNDGDTSSSSNLTIDFGIFAPNPAVSLKKYTNGCDAQTASGSTAPTAPCPTDDGQNNPVVAVGSTVNWTYKVSNDGNVPLTNVNVADSDNAVTVDCNGAAAGDGQGFNLAVGATLTCTATGTATKGQYANTGTVTAEGETTPGGTPAKLPTDSDDSDDSHYWAGSSGLTIKKYTNVTSTAATAAVDDADTAAGLDASGNHVVAAGSSVYWVYVVNNTGNVSLSNVNVTDDQGVTVTCPATTLAANDDAPGGTDEMTCRASGTLSTPGQYTNIGTVKGTDSTSNPSTPTVLTATDPSNAFVAQPGVSIKKYTNTIDAVGDADTGTGPAVAVKSTVVWSYVVTNTGNTRLSPVTVTDDTETGTISCPSTGLDAGASMTCTLTGTAAATPVNYTNIGSVEGTPVDPNGATLPGIDKVTDTNPSAYHTIAMSLGNRVWEDANNNGVINTTEQGIAGVTVNLYADADGNGVPDGAVVDTMKTNIDGYYLFTNLQPGTYIVEIVPPAGYSSSTGLHSGFEPAPDPDLVATDSDDNGTTAAAVIRSAPVTLTLDGEPTGEPATPQLTDNATDTNSNMTVDFGLFRGLALGDVVFVDSNDNGRLDGTEAGIDGVNVTLFDASGNEVEVGPDGIFGTTDDAQGGMTTHDGGHYLFSSLPAGDYVVKIAVPAGYRSSTDIASSADPNNDTNSDDNGIGRGATTVSSAIVSLGFGIEPTNDGDTDANTNLSVDFGVFDPNPSVSLKKFTNGCDAQTASGAAAPTAPCPIDNGQNNPIVAIGGAVTWTYRVTNTGNVPLSDVRVADSDTTVAVDCNGEAAGDGQGFALAVGSSLTCSATGVAKDGQYENTGTVTAKGETTPGSPDGPLTPDADDSDISHYFGSNSAITIKKYTNLTSTPAFAAVDDADVPAGLDLTGNHVVPAGTTLYWAYVVTNTGNVALSNVTVTDDKGVAVTCPSSTLAASDGEPGGSDEMVCTASGRLDTVGQYTNVGTVTGTDATTEPSAPKQLTASDPSNAFVTQPGVSIKKYTNTVDAVGDADTGSGPAVPVKGAVRWIYVVTNTGNTRLDQVAVSDDVEGGIACPKASLAVGESMTCELTGTAPAAPTEYHNVGSVTGTPVDGNGTPIPGSTPVTDSNPSAYHAVAAAIGDRVWEDLNANGIQDKGEPGVADVTVNVRDTDGNIVGTTTTDGNGNWLVDNLPPGDYTVEFIAPDGWTITVPNVGTNDAVDSDGDATGHTAVTNLEGGETDLTWDLGLYRPAAIGDFVFHDRNRDGVQDSGEEPIKGVKVTLFDATGAVVATTTTDASGHYLFDGLRPGTYHVGFTAPDGWVATKPDKGGDDATDSDANPLSGLTIPTELVSGEKDLTWDAGLYKPVVIGDTIWLDSDHDGVQDTNEPGVPGVILDLYDGNGTHIGTTTTDGKGHYHFDDSNTTGLLPDTKYQIHIENPKNFVDGGPLHGFKPTDMGKGNSGTDSNIDSSSTGWIIDVTTPAEGGADMTFDGGVYKPGVGDLAIQKSVVSTSKEVADSNNIKWSLVVTNVGTATIDGPVTVIDTIPAGQAYTSASGESWSCSNSGQLITCRHDEAVKAGDKLPDIAVTTRTVVTAQVYTNTAEVRAPGDTNPANNTDDAKIDLGAAVVHSDSENNVKPSGTATSTPVTTHAPGALALTGSSTRPGARTGSDIALTVLAAMALLGVGAGLVLVSRRRRREEG